MNTPILINSLLAGTLLVVVKPGVILPVGILGLSNELLHALLVTGGVYLVGPTLFSFAQSLAFAAPSTQKVSDTVYGINSTKGAAMTEQSPRSSSNTTNSSTSTHCT